MEDHGSAGTAMLGLGGFVLLGVSDADGELEQVIETTADSAWCRGCGVRARPHGRRLTVVRDLPSAGGRSCCCGLSGCGAARSWRVRS